MNLRIRNALNASVYEIFIGIVSALGAVLGAVLTYSKGPVESAAGSAAGTIIFLLLAVLIVHLVKPRYTIKDKRFKDIFIEKLVSDVSRFSDSNTENQEANNKILRDSAAILEYSKSYLMLKEEVDELSSIEGWIKKGLTNKPSFSEIMDRRGLLQVAGVLSEQVKKYMQVPFLKINTSIVEPGCVALVEKMIDLGIPIIHENSDINGIEQARTLASDVEYSCSFIPFSTIYLSRERTKIIEKYDYLCPITWEEQMLLGKRDLNGEYNLDKVTCPKRGSGHYQLLTMIQNGELGLSADNPIDLGDCNNSERDAIVLYQPVAEIYREVKRKSEPWGYIRSVPFPVHIVLVINEKDFGQGLASFHSLLIVLMALMKSDLQKTINYASKLYGKDNFRDAFENAADHFANIIKK